MGLAASQFALGMLVDEKARIEAREMTISNNKRLLAKEQSNLSQEYYSKLQRKKLNYYNNGAYLPVTYSYLMGDANYKNAMINNAAISMLSEENAAGLSINTPAVKTDDSIILTDYRGLVVLNGEYANAIKQTLGNKVKCDGNGRGSTFSQDAIPEIIANYLGYTPGGNEYNILMAVYNNDKNAINTLLPNQTDGTKPDGTNVTNGFKTNIRTQPYEALINFYKPIFQSCATNGWTTEYSSNLSDSEYINNAVASGIFQLQTIDRCGKYEPGTSLQYYLNAAFLTERRDSVEQEELTAWFNSEKEKIAEKESYWDIELQNISTELAAINTEIESVQSFIDNEVSSKFSMGT